LIVDFVGQGFEFLSIFQTRFRVVDRTGADRDREPFVFPLEDVVVLIPVSSNQLAPLLGERQLFFEFLGGAQGNSGTNIQGLRGMER